MGIPVQSSIGNKNKGFTFIEIMVALVILSAGIVMVYKSFFQCLGYLSYLTCRLYASEMIESKIAGISHSYQQSQDATFDRGAMTESIEVNHKWIDFNYNIETSAVAGLDYVYRLNITLTWFDGRHRMTLSRESLLSKI